MYAIEFYETINGYCPVESWLSDLTPTKQRAVYAALTEVLEQEGTNVCGSFWAPSLGDGLLELRVRHNEQQIRALTGQSKPGGAKSNPEKILLRIFCHAYGDKIVVLQGHMTSPLMTKLHTSRNRSIGPRSVWRTSSVA